MTSTPHYLRVARALALVTGLAGLSGCAESTTLETDSGAAADAALTGDSGREELDAGETLDAAEPMLDSGPALADSGSPGLDSGQADGGVIDPCATCTCDGFGIIDSGPDAVTCESTGHFECCAVIGPLFPPDFAA